jgi:hypothetical protein
MSAPEESGSKTALSYMTAPCIISPTSRWGAWPSLATKSGANTWPASLRGAASTAIVEFVAVSQSAAAWSPWSVILKLPTEKC